MNLDDIDYDDLDPGIREVVRRLNKAGFATCDSGDGVSKTEAIADGEAEPFPHVYIQVPMADDLIKESYRLKTLVESWGICVEPVGFTPVWIQATFDPSNEYSPVLMLTGVSDKALDQRCKGCSDCAMGGSGRDCKPGNY
jgi:hypothetical protein